MIHINILELEKYSDSTKYERVDGGIYKDLNDADRTNHRLALSFELEEGEDTQYPIEDVLDKYRIHVSEFIESANPNIMNLELAGKIENLRLASSVIGKRVYNKDVSGENDESYVDLIIE